MADKKQEDLKLIKEYNAKQFFDSRYKKLPEFADQNTLSPFISYLDAAFHYKNIELNIIKGLKNFKEFCLKGEIKNGCDIGSGTGHWVKFLNEDLNVKNIVAIEISSVACKKLEKIFLNNANITVENIDISLGQIKYKNDFDIITGIATFHHIVNDKSWENSLQNVSYALRSGGLAIITDMCGFRTKNSTYIKSSEFATWKKNQGHKKTPSLETPYLMKRNRSLRYYKRIFNKYGCNVDKVIWNRGGWLFGRIYHQFNIMFITKK
jgi:SAM-dependent methyltransferase